MSTWSMPWLPRHLARHTITRYLAAELSIGEAEHTQRHLLTCARCARRCEEQQFAHHTLRRLALDRPVPRALDTRLRAQLASPVRPAPLRPLRFLRAAAQTRLAAPRPAPPTAPRRGSSFWAVAAVLVVAVTSAALFGPLGPRAHQKSSTASTSEVPAGWNCAPPPTQDLANPATWSREHMALNSVVMLSDSVGWAVGEYVGSRGAILNDVSGSWLLGYTTPPAVLRDISMDSQTDGWVVGEDCTQPGHALMVHLSGSTWTPVDASAFGALSSVAMLSADNGWAAGPGVLLHYDGNSWTAVPTPRASGATSLALLSATNAWAVGANGTILHGDGEQWSSVAGGDGPDLNALAFANPNEGWAVGGYPTVDGPGALAHYHNGQWSLVNAPESEELFGVRMVSPSEGWAVGGSDLGVVLHYTHNHWNVVFTHGLPGLRALAMVSPTAGWAVGLDGALVHFHDGIWDQQLRTLW